MDEFGRFRFIYEPGTPSPFSETIDHSVEMTISGEADLTQLTTFFVQFLKASGYLLDGKLSRSER